MILAGYSMAKVFDSIELKHCPGSIDSLLCDFIHRNAKLQGSCFYGAYVFSAFLFLHLGQTGVHQYAAEITR